MPRQRIRNFRASLQFVPTSGKHVVLPSGIDLTGKSYSIAMWVSRNDLSRQQCLVSQGSLSLNSGLFLRLQSDNRVGFDQFSASMSSTSQITDTYRHHHLAFIYDKPTGTRRIYIDGRLDATVAGFSDFLGTGPLYLGRRMNTDAEWLSALMSSFRIFTGTALTNDQVTELYLSGRALGLETLNWLMGEGAGATVYDTSGNGLNGTINGGLSYSTDVPMVSRLVLSPNLVRDGGFEHVPPFVAPQNTAGRWLDGTASGSLTRTAQSIIVSPLGAGFTVQYDSTVSHSGNGSIKIHAEPGSVASVKVGVPANGYRFNPAQNAFPLQPNTQYKLTCWIKTANLTGSSTNGFYVRVPRSNVAGTAAAGADEGWRTPRINVNQDWTYYEIPYTTEADCASGFIELYAVTSGGAGTLAGDAWFDDVSITLATPPARSVVAGPYRQPISNLIRNGNFEFAPAYTADTSANSVWITGVASGSATNDTYGWGTLLKSGTVAVRFDPAGRRGNAMKLSTLAGSSNVQVSTSIASNQAAVQRYGIPVQPSTAYRLSGWIKTAYVSGDALGAFLDFSERAITGGQVTTTTTTPIKATQDWTYMEVVVNTNAATRYVLPKLYVDGSTGGTNNLIMDAWFDDISLTPVTPIVRLAL